MRDWRPEQPGVTTTDSTGQRVYCSEWNETEPMAGTADHVGVWILLEYKPQWKAKALEENSLDADTRRWLDDSVTRLRADGHRPRPQLVRQPDVDSDEVRLFIGTPDRLLVFTGAGYGFLRQLNLSRIVARPSAHASLAEPRYFVCTNGQRDRCCARYGLPSYAALRELVGERAWQVTHLGGHRFAPNVLALPQGALYGRVHPALLPEFVARVESGALCFPQLRGRTWYPKPVQAAEAMLARSDLRMLHVDGDDQSARVTFASVDGTHEVAVRQQLQPVEVLASCGDEALKQVFPYQRLDRAQ
jgi:hypothetical protein